MNPTLALEDAALHLSTVPPPWHGQPEPSHFGREQAFSTEMIFRLDVGLSQPSAARLSLPTSAAPSPAALVVGRLRNHHAERGGDVPR